MWNQVKVWGHSHVNMSTNPSTQDDSQMEFFENSGHEWFIRIIMNKKGSINITLYDYANNLIYTDLDCVILYDEGDAWEVQSEIDALLELYQELEEKKEMLMDEKLKATLVSIEAEFVKKVKTKTYGYTNVYGKRYGSTYSNTYGTVKKTGYAGYQAQSTHDLVHCAEGYLKESKSKDIGMNLLQGAQDVYYYFDMGELAYLGSMSKKEAAEEIRGYLAGDDFTQADITAIYQVACEVFEEGADLYDSQYAHIYGR